MTGTTHPIFPSSSTTSLPSPTNSEDSQPTTSAPPVEDNLHHHHTHPPTPSLQYQTSASEDYAELPPVYLAHPSGQVIINYSQTNPWAWNYAQTSDNPAHSSSAGLDRLAAPSFYNIDGLLMNMMNVPSSSQGAPPQEASYQFLHYTAASGPGPDSVFRWGAPSTSAALDIPVPGDAGHNLHTSTSRGVDVTAEVVTRYPYLPVSPVPSYILSHASDRSHLQLSGSTPSRETAERFPTREAMGYPRMLPSPISDNNPSPYAMTSPTSDYTRGPRLAKDGVIRASESRRKHEANYQCACGQSFTTRNGLRNHDKAHRGIREFKCQHCPKDFVTKHDCKRHEKSCHKSPWVPITQA